MSVETVAEQMHVDDGASKQVLESDVADGLNAVLHIGQASVVPLERLSPLATIAASVARSPRRIVQVTERVAPPAGEVLEIGPDDREIGLTQPQRQLVVLLAPTPVAIAHAVRAHEVLTPHGHHATYERRVVVLRVQAGCADVHDPFTRWVRIVEPLVHRQQVHVVHDHVVRRLGRHEESHVDQ